MNTNTQSQHAVGQGRPQFLKLIFNSASITLGIVLAVDGILGPCAMDQTAGSKAETNFNLAAAQGSMTEVKLGELAAQKGTRADVKEYGQMMVKDHTAINDDMKALAAQKGVTLPDSLDAKHQKMVDKMSALTGAEFDDAYI